MRAHVIDKDISILKKASNLQSYIRFAVKFNCENIFVDLIAVIVLPMVLT